MNKKGHWLFGAFLGFVFIFFADYAGFIDYTFSVVSVLIALGIICFYSILPDIDHPAGTMTWMFLGIATFGIVLGLAASAFNILLISTLLLVFIFISAHWLPHRGFIHSVPVGILSVIPLWYLFNSMTYCALGYVAWHSHLFADGYIFKIK